MRIQMLQKAPMKAVGIEMTVTLEPALIARNPIDAVVAQALKHLRGDVGTLLRRPGRDRMQTVKLRGEQPHEAQLSLDPTLAQLLAKPPATRWIRIHRLI